MTDDILLQFDLAWALSDLHLSALDEDNMLWEPAPLCWTVRPDSSGVWRPDWADAEPDPVPVPTIGWLTWHIDWWWSTTIDHLTAATPRDRTDITWPGSGAVAVSRLRDLARRWREILMTADFERPSAFPWGTDAGRTITHTALWVNIELTKNIAEIGQLRLLRAAGASGPSACMRLHLYRTAAILPAWTSSKRSPSPAGARCSTRSSTVSAPRASSSRPCPA